MKKGFAVLSDYCGCDLREEGMGQLTLNPAGF